MSNSWREYCIRTRHQNILIQRQYITNFKTRTCKKGENEQRKFGKNPSESKDVHDDIQRNLSSFSPSFWLLKRKGDWSNKIMQNFYVFIIILFIDFRFSSSLFSFNGESWKAFTYVLRNWMNADIYFSSWRQNQDRRKKWDKITFKRINEWYFFLLFKTWID